jgi:PKD repeat protein
MNWNFGDSAVSSLESPTHSYTENGVFDVSLIATTEGSTCSDTLILTDLMEVFRTPTANFTFKPTDASMLDPRIFFSNTSTDASAIFMEFWR